MCGIAGIYNLYSTRPVTTGELESMLATMPYRGPDAHGTQRFGERAGFGHLRLSILDLRPESNQPFEIDGGDLVITYNGEIFNYIELREELEALGHHFRTESDTEVLLRAYKHWGPAVMPRLNGMWAFAIYDRRQDTLFCARDRFGIKPFNYLVHQGRLLFASEIKAILALDSDLAQPDYESLSRVLRASVGARGERTCFANIRRLPPAHTLTATRHGIKIERYWDYPLDTLHGVSFADSAQRVHDLLVDSLRLRMRSDVPVGLTLSGGLDSSALACLLRNFFYGDFDTFTAAYQGESYDESGDAQQLAESLEMRSNLIPATQGDFLGTLRQVVRHLESPTHSHAVFPLWNIMRAARRRVTVLLEGQGADELLAGYKSNFYEACRQQLRRGKLRQAYSEMRWAAHTVGAVNALLMAAREANPPFLPRVFRRLRGDGGVYIGPLQHCTERPESERRILHASDRLNASLIRQMEGGLVDLLHYGDAMSMAHSIESRLPFLDHRLIEFCLRIPGDFKYRDGLGKLVLREAVRKEVPARIIDTRAKLGFPTPIARWFRERPDLTIYPVLHSAACRQRGVFAPQAIDAAIARHIAGQIDLSSNIYRWIITELWFQEFIDRQPGGRPLPEPTPAVAAAN
ncbi:MAG: asparagine synthase (glutamine-hydrolyzing) [Pirellulales bacterium]|nr:asparagine synthase (glutamine-hydrolyzing) [Pirellulales bacterium]